METEPLVLSFMQKADSVVEEYSFGFLGRAPSSVSRLRRGDSGSIFLSRGVDLSVVRLDRRAVRVRIGCRSFSSFWCVRHAGRASGGRNFC